MSVKLKYISTRLLICAALGELLLLLMGGYIWIVSLKRAGGFILASAFTLAIFLGNLLVFRLVVRPYRETKKVYEQFAMGHVLNDLFDTRYPYAPEAEQAVRKFNEMIDRSNLVNVSKSRRNTWRSRIRSIPIFSTTPWRESAARRWWPAWTAWRR